MLLFFIGRLRWSTTAAAAIILPRGERDGSIAVTFLLLARYIQLSPGRDVFLSPGLADKKIFWKRNEINCERNAEEERRAVVAVLFCSASGSFGEDK